MFIRSIMEPLHDYYLNIMLTKLNAILEFSIINFFNEKTLQKCDIYYQPVSQLKTQNIYTPHVQL